MLRQLILAASLLSPAPAAAISSDSAGPNSGTDSREPFFTYHIGMGWASRSDDLPQVGFSIGARHRIARTLQIGILTGAGAIGSAAARHDVSASREITAVAPALAEFVLGPAPAHGLSPKLFFGAGAYYYRRLPGEGARFLFGTGSPSGQSLGRLKLGYCLGAGLEYRLGHIGVGVEAREHDIQGGEDPRIRMRSALGTLYLH